MIVEERVYTLHVGKMNAYLQLYESQGLPIALEELGNLIGYFKSEIGHLNQVVHLWGFEDLNDRTQRRAKLGGREDWRNYASQSGTYIQQQETRILIPTSFSPIR
ncbi:MAG: NIPSNAP family protein [Actinobacteria bacterium]|nr:NIPSNAP family protein [Actinomycetota bacterium]